MRCLFLIFILLAACDLQLIQTIPSNKTEPPASTIPVESITDPEPIDTTAIVPVSDPFAVIQTSPLLGAMDVDITRPIVIIFNSAVERRTIVRDNIRITSSPKTFSENPFGLAVLSYDANIRKLTITPGQLADPRALAGQTVHVEITNGLQTLYKEWLKPYTLEFTVEE